MESNCKLTLQNRIQMSLESPVVADSFARLPRTRAQKIGNKLLLDNNLTIMYRNRIFILSHFATAWYQPLGGKQLN